MKENWKQKHTQLAVKQRKIESEVTALVKHKQWGALTSEFIELRKVYEQLASKTNKERRESFDRIGETRLLVKRLKEDKKRFLDGEDIKMDLGDQANAIKTQLRDIKAVQEKQYRQLGLLADQLEEEIFIEEETFNIQKSRPQTTKRMSQRKKQNKETEAGNEMSYEEFINYIKEKRQWADPIELKSTISRLDQEWNKNGGRDCGWHRAEQDDFLKLLSRCHNNPDSAKFRKELPRAFPLYASDELEEHIRRHKSNKEIGVLKKRLLKAYKELSLKMVEKEVGDVKVEEPVKNPVKLPNLVERNQMKRKIIEWKREKELEEFIKQEKEKDNQKQVKEAEKAKLRHHSEQLKKIRKEKEFKRQRDELIRKKEEELRKLQRPVFSPDTLKRIKMKEKTLLRRRSEALKRKHEEKTNKELMQQKIVEKQKSKFAFVKNRFDHQTTSVIKKQVEKFDARKMQGKYGHNFAGVIVRTTGRRLANWRANIN